MRTLELTEFLEHSGKSLHRFAVELRFPTEGSLLAAQLQLPSRFRGR